VSEEEAQEFTIRAAEEPDLEDIAAIYRQHVYGGDATSDFVAQPPTYWAARMQSTVSGDHILVAEPDDGGRIVGYAYSAPFRQRPAYRFTRETSVYLSAQAAGKGLGTRLYEELLQRLRDDDMHTAIALITMPNKGSEKLHLRMGFENIGVMREAGRELGEWRDAGWFQLML
jgi:phosphinothricin acetyltransferase